MRRDPARALNVLYSLAIERLDDKARKQFEVWLNTVPIRERVHSRRTISSDPFQAQLMATAAAYKAKVEGQ